MWAVSALRKRGFDDLVLDFSECKGVSPNEMIPLLLTTEALRRDGVGRGRPDFRANPAAHEKQETLALRMGP